MTIQIKYAVITNCCGGVISSDWFILCVFEDVKEKMKWRCVKIGTKNIPKRVRSISQDIEHEYLWNGKEASAAISQNMDVGAVVEETQQRLKAECEQPLNTHAFKAGER